MLDKIPNCIMFSSKAAWFSKAVKCKLFTFLMFVSSYLKLLPFLLFLKMDPGKNDGGEKNPGLFFDYLKMFWRCLIIILKINCNCIVVITTNNRSKENKSKFCALLQLFLQNRWWLFESCCLSEVWI